MFLNVDAGPFTPLVGYVGAILATVYGIWTLIWKKKVWETPQDIIPATVRGLLGIILGIGMVFIWLGTNPKNISSKINLAIVLAIIASLSFILYLSLIRALTYEKDVAVSPKKVKLIKVIGGLWLRSSAKEAIRKNGIRTIQELLKGAAYNVDELWSRFSQELSKSFIIILYLTIVSCGTLGLTTAGFIVQVKLTNKPASEIINANESPGLKDSSNQKGLKLSDLDIEAYFLNKDGSTSALLLEKEIEEITSLKTETDVDENILKLQFHFTKQQIGSFGNFRFNFGKPFSNKLGSDRGAPIGWSPDLKNGVWIYTASDFKNVIKFEISYLN